MAWRVAGIGLILSLLIPSFIFARSGTVLLKADFDDGSLEGWRTAGDLCVTPEFCAGRPSGRYWVAFSTNSTDHDSITMCGSSAVQGMQSILRSPEMLLPFKTSRIRVEFSVKFMTNESTSSNLGSDNFTARLLTVTGPIVIASIDNSGASPASKNLTIQGDTTFHESGCAQNWKFETGMLRVSYDRTYRSDFVSKMADGPIALEFELTNEFDQEFSSAVVLDDVRVTIYP